MTTPEQSLQPASESFAAPLGAPPIPLPADRPALTPAPARPWLRRTIDVLLVSMVLVFAFLAASFAVRNSDFWMHLAAGRLLAKGDYQFGVDPFAYTTQNVYWANHAWLFDLLLYWLYQLDQHVGGVLVILKALLVVVLAVVLLSMGRPGGRIAVPAACTMLAVLAMTPRLLLHSTILSYVFLGLTLWLLWRAYKRPPTLGSLLKRYAPLLPLFVLWVNVDDWFLLGPLTAALFWLGDLLLPDQAGGEARPRTPTWVWPAGLAVCLLNPHLFRAFSLPLDLAPLPAELRDDPRFAALSATPWQVDWFYHPVGGVSLAASAYVLLLAVGLLSFVLNGRNVVGWRLLTFLAFAGLSAWLARAIPFFAVVAAPITALNLQDVIHRREEARGARGTFLPRASYLLLFVSGLALIFLAWPGWLQGFRDTGRHVDWAVQPNRSLERVAQTLEKWRKDGKLSEADRGFAVHPSVVHYCAWYCPNEKGFLDSRVSLFGAVVGEFEEVCRAVNPSFGSPDGDWRKILRAHGITHLILYESEPTRLLPALSRVTLDESDWTLLDIDGQALLAGWKDRGRALPDGVPAFDAERLAFAPETMGESLTLPPAPGQGPPRGPRTANFWSHFGRAVPPPSWETNAADVLLHYANYRGMKRQRELMVSWFGWAAGVCTQPALAAGSLDGALRSAVRFGPAPLLPVDPSQQPPGVPLLAVRAARSALASNPDDTGAWMNLGGAYFALVGQTPERVLLSSFSPLDQLRRIQIAVALENALRLNPDLQPAHENLANLYQGQRYFDIALDHWREALRLAERGGPSPGETAQAFADRLKPMQAHVRDLQRFVGDQKNQFALSAQKAGSEPYRKARFAKQLGLAKLALEDVLMQSTMVLLGGEGIRLEMELMLEMGRIDLVRDQLNSPDWQANKQNLGFFDVPAPTGSASPPMYRLPAYDWLWLCQAAAAGDYDQVDDALRALAADASLPLDGGRGKARPREEIVELRRAMAQVLPLEIAMSMNNLNWLPRYIVSSERQLLSEPLARYSRFLTEQADMQVLAGLLALERGTPEAAKEAFEQALTLSRLGGGETHPSIAQPLALAYLQLIRDARRGK